MSKKEKKQAINACLANIEKIMERIEKGTAERAVLFKKLQSAVSKPNYEPMIQKLEGMSLELEKIKEDVPQKEKPPLFPFKIPTSHVLKIELTPIGVIA